MGSYINYNGQVLPEDQPILKAGNRNYQYGDGLFETMRISNGNILFEQAHFDRLFSGLHSLKFKIPAAFNAEYLREAIFQLCMENGHRHARVRLTIFRRIATADDPDQPAFIIESWALQSDYVFNSSPFGITVYPDMRKTADDISAYKTCSYLPYALAAVFARQQGFGDALVLNSAGKVCDSSIANVFWVKNEVVHTPPLSEGCIAGIMRRHLLDNMEAAGFNLAEAPLTIDMLSAASEVFLTNVIRGIMPVARFGEASYSTGLTAQLFKTLVAPLIVP